MIDFVIEVAGYAVRVRSMFESTRDFCAGYLCDRKPDLELEMSIADIELERNKCARSDRLEAKTVRVFPDPYLETLALQRKLTDVFFQYDILLFHGSVVAVDGQGYLFAAKSGTGKSTHTRLWREVFGNRVVMINDDKPFLRFVNDTVMVCGTPWNGKHKLGNNACVPLRAVCMLSRGLENHIQEITAADILPELMQQSQRPGTAENFPKYLELLDRLASGVRFYRLECNMEPEAAVVSYEKMRYN